MSTGKPRLSLNDVHVDQLLQWSLMRCGITDAALLPMASGHAERVHAVRPQPREERYHGSLA